MEPQHHSPLHYMLLTRRSWITFSQQGGAEFKKKKKKKKVFSLFCRSKETKFHLFPFFALFFLSSPHSPTIVVISVRISLSSKNVCVIYKMLPCPLIKTGIKTLWCICGYLPLSFIKTFVEPFWFFRLLSKRSVATFHSALIKTLVEMHVFVYQWLLSTICL